MVQGIKQYKEYKCKQCNKIFEDNIKKNRIFCSCQCRQNYGESVNTGKTRFKKNYIPWNKGINMWKNKQHPRGNYINGRSLEKSPARYGDDWDKIRYLVYKRDKFTCQKCKINKVKLDVHHKIPFEISKDNSVDNLISLCRSCHMKEEWDYFKNMKGGLNMRKNIKNKQ